MIHTYVIHDIFGPTIQGEGTLAGVPCLFIRFAACNMWDGRPEHREASKCPFCDTDFYGGTRMSAMEIVWKLQDMSPYVQWVWISGGEPLLQMDVELARGIHEAGYSLALETNGTRMMSPDLWEMFSHVTISPKVPREQIMLARAHTLKLLYPHPNPRIKPEAFSDYPAEYYYLQPIDVLGDPEATKVNMKRTVEATLARAPQWRLSVQTHKILGVE